MAINEDLIEQLRYHWVKDIGLQVDNALAAPSAPSTTPATESTPDTLTSSTLNQIGSGTHTHAIEAVSDASTIGNYGKLLKAGPTGGLGLGPGGLSVAGPLGVTGATTVNGVTNTGGETISGDLNVGAGLLQTNVAGGRIGIGMAPDPQFMLDVAGPVRAPYFIGKHAIQLADALLIAHYDGKENDLTGAAEGHRGQAVTLVGNVTWQKGKFSKAVALGEATTNLHPNPDFEGGISGWTNGPAGTLTHNAEKPWLGRYSGKATLTGTGGGGNGYVYCPVTLTGTTTYTYSAYVWCAVPATLQIMLTDAGFTNTLASPSLSVPAKTWTRLVWTGTTNANTARRFLINNVGAATVDVWIDACQIEQKFYPTPYTPSTRVDTALRYSSVGNIDRAIGTVMLWCNLSTSNFDGGLRCIFRVDTTAGEISISADSGNVLRFYWGATTPTSNGGSITPGVWTHLALTNDGQGNLAFYVNGVLTGSNSNGSQVGSVSSFGGDPTIDIGKYFGGSNFCINGMIDELAITGSAASATLIRAVFDSDAPVFAESSTFSFRIPKSTVWADENGLFVLSDAGNPVLGAIAATGGYSWGGQTLQAGDFLLGYGNNYLKWDKTATKLLLSAGDALTTIDNTGMTLSGGNTYDTRSSITFKVSGTQVANIYSLNQAAGSPYAKLTLESRPPQANAFGAVQLITSWRNGAGVESALTQLILTGENLASGSKEDLYLDGTIRRSFNKDYSRELLVYGEKTLYSFGPAATIFTLSGYSVASACHFHLAIKSSSGLSIVFTGNIVAGGATQLFTLDAANDIAVSMPGGVLQWARNAGARTYQGVMDVTAVY